MKRDRSADHVRIGNNELICEHCGDRQPLSFPMSFRMVKAVSDAYLKDHRNCRKPKKVAP